jgi:hypothetical protein
MVSATWDVLWTWRAPKIAWAELLPWQRVNHFPQARHLTRKDLLKKHLQRQRQLSDRLAESFDIMPLTFTLPAELLAFTEAFSMAADAAKEAAAAAEAAASELQRNGADPGTSAAFARAALAAQAATNLWILKPVGLSRGRGISMVADISDVAYGEPMVIQRYVADPLLLDGYKFDLRLYVCVTSTHPLEAFLYREGFGRFATEPFSLSLSQLRNLFVHLTNSSIQKEQPDAQRAAAVPGVDAEEGGTKVALSQLKRRLAAAGMDVDVLWARIVDVILRSLYAVHEAIPASPNSFELFGYDVLIDAQLKPWLIEVNSSPQLTRDNPLDYQIKEALLADTLSLIAPPLVDRAVWSEMLRWRLERERATTPPSFTAELCALLHGMTPRAPGEPVPAASAGLYDRIAPSPAWDKLCAGRSKAPGAGAVAAARSRASFEVPAASMRRQRPDLSKYL